MRRLTIAMTLLPALVGSGQDPTPGSLIYPRGPDCGGTNCESTGHRTLSARGSSKNTLGAAILELHGWLGIESQHPNPENTSGDPKEFDWNFGLELDPDWVAAVGADVNELIRVGNIRREKTWSDALRAHSKPILHVELRSWTPRETKYTTRPAGWDFLWPDGRSYWPWDPRCPSNDPLCPVERALSADDYVSMKGSLVTDDDHGNGAQANWGDEQGRWVELHPPDFIKRQVSRPHAKRVECIAVYSPRGLFSGTPTVDDFTLSPPPEVSKPARAMLECDELVSPETNRETIIDGNPQRTGARIIRSLDRCDVHIAVQGQSILGVPGKFKATYLAYWKQLPPPPPPLPSMITKVTPNMIVLKQRPHPNPRVPLTAAGTVEIVVTALADDPQRGLLQLRDAQVFVDSQGPFPVFKAFIYKFSSGFDDGVGQWSVPRIVVKYQGYSDAVVAYQLEVRP